MLSLQLNLFASAGFARAMDIGSIAPSDLGIIIGILFALFVGILIFIDYIKNKFKS